MIHAVQLAQLNIGRLAAPLADPQIKEFVDNLDPINALAEQSAGFIWRLKGDGNDATSIRAFDDDLMIVNMSVWRDFESLKAYVYQSDHTQFVRERKKWFSALGEMHMALWWVPAGHVPTVAEALDRLAHLRQHGETAHAFTFRKPFTEN